MQKCLPVMAGWSNKRMITTAVQQIDRKETYKQIFKKLTLFSLCVTSPYCSGWRMAWADVSDVRVLVAGDLTKRRNCR